MAGATVDHLRLIIQVYFELVVHKQTISLDSRLFSYMYEQRITTEHCVKTCVGELPHYRGQLMYFWANSEIIYP